VGGAYIVCQVCTEAGAEPVANYLQAIDWLKQKKPNTAIPLLLRQIDNTPQCARLHAAGVYALSTAYHKIGHALRRSRPAVAAEVNASVTTLMTLCVVTIVAELLAPLECCCC
jgi:hypothetical protein